MPKHLSPFCMYFTYECEHENVIYSITQKSESSSVIHKLWYDQAFIELDSSIHQIAKQLYVSDSNSLWLKYRPFFYDHFMVSFSCRAPDTINRNPSAINIPQEKKSTVYQDQNFQKTPTRTEINPIPQFCLKIPKHPGNTQKKSQISLSNPPISTNTPTQCKRVHQSPHSPNRNPSLYLSRSFLARRNTRQKKSFRDRLSAERKGGGLSVSQEPARESKTDYCQLLPAQLSS